MNTKRICRELLSMGLAAALFLFSVLPVSAAELPEGTVPETAAMETIPQETTEPGIQPVETETTEPVTQATEPVETEPATQPTEAVETEPATQPTEAVETEPVTQPTESAATEPATQPTESAATEPATQPTESAATEPATQPTESVETQPTTQPTQPGQRESSIRTIEEARNCAVGTENITIRGTVVYLSGTSGVLQDDTGGIRVSFPEEPQTMPGDVLVATGRRSGGLQIREFAIVDTTHQLPSRDSTLLDAPENLRVRIRNAVLGNKTLSQNGFSMSLHGIPTELEQGSRVDAYGVILDGWFYADTLAESITAAPSAAVAEESEWNLYFGLLHAHIGVSDGVGTVWEAFEHASKVEGLDFFAVTDHSNSFENAQQGSIFTDGNKVSPDWKSGKDAAASVTNENFVGIFGYEMTWPELTDRGHINTFNTLGWQTRDQQNMGTLEEYYQVLAQDRNSISQFNHPSQFYGHFDSFANRTAEFDAVIQLLEVGGEGSLRAYDFYNTALDAGWHVAPTISQNNHNGSWGDASPVRTVVLAEKLERDSLYEALRSYRVYATEDSDLSIRYRANGAVMGSILGPTDQLTIVAELADPTDDAIGLVEVIVDGGHSLDSETVEGSSGTVTMEVSGNYSYYYLRVTQEDGDIAVTAPIWVDQFQEVGLGELEPSDRNPTQGDAITLSVKLFNEESQDFVLESVEFCANGQPVPDLTYPAVVGALSDETLSATYLHQEPGQVIFSVKITGTIAGQLREREEELTLMYRSGTKAIPADIGTVRQGLPGTTYRISGRITAGNENPYNTFPGYLYLQDATGGIAVKGEIEAALELGEYLEITGVLLEEDGNLILNMTAYQLSEVDSVSPAAKAVPCVQTLDYETYGGQLLQIQGTAISLTSEGKAVSRFTLRDSQGGQATVLIEEEIRSGTFGVNELASKVKKGRTIVAVGLLHVDEYGKSVLRVRDCDEIRYSPAILDPTNPRTGDWLAAVEAWFKSLWQ